MENTQYYGLTYHYENEDVEKELSYICNFGEFTLEESLYKDEWD